MHSGRSPSEARTANAPGAYLQATGNETSAVFADRLATMLRGCTATPVQDLQVQGCPAETSSEIGTVAETHSSSNERRRADCGGVSKKSKSQKPN